MARVAAQRQNGSGLHSIAHVICRLSRDEPRPRSGFDGKSDTVTRGVPTIAFPDTDAEPDELASVCAVIGVRFDAAWAVLADFAHPERLAPSIDRTSVNGSGVGTIRVVHSSRGLEIHEQLVECDEAAGRFRYAILPTGDMPFAGVDSYDCLVRLTPSGQNSTAIEWRSEGRLSGDPAPVRTSLDELYRGAIRNIEALASKDPTADADAV